MLGSAQRLRRSSEFSTAVRRGRRAGRGAVVVHLAQPTESSDTPAPADEAAPPARAGFIVSRTVGSAVTRNRVRRRLRHLVRGRLTDLPPGTLLVVRALPGAAERPYARLAADLDAALAAVRASGKPSRRT
ncbi:MAG TPA: ribonuclease P protein component [Micromonosporaceae bacterium]